MAGTNLPPLLCTRGCGFYGSSETNNLCSKCYKGFLTALATEFGAKVKVSTTSSPSPSVPADSSSVSTPPIVKNRCESCNKKVGFMGFTCRCGKVLCGAHRYPKEHACNFDSRHLIDRFWPNKNPLLMLTS